MKLTRFIWTLHPTVSNTSQELPSDAAEPSCKDSQTIQAAKNTLRPAQLPGSRGGGREGTREGRKEEGEERRREGRRREDWREGEEEEGGKGRRKKAGLQDLFFSAGILVTLPVHLFSAVRD